MPWFSTLFGRDALISSLQSIAFAPRLAIQTLEILAKRQATAVDAWRDAEPGKMLHELRTGEMSRTGELPFAPYYGSIDATPLWLILLGETHNWTADDALVDRLWPNALAALDWIDNWGDRDGDGFVEYERQAESGLRNQGWKDSSDAIRWLDGTLAETPVALAEVQGYVFDAKRRIAKLARRRGDEAMADRLEGEAAELQRKFGEQFRLPDGSIAMALDRSKKPVDAVGSNAGHALWTGIVQTEHAEAVAVALGTPDMVSGWGLRTYAANRRATTRLATTREPSGRTTPRSRLRDFGATASTTRPTPCRAACWPRRSTSPHSACPSCSADSTGRPPVPRSPTPSPAPRRRGPQGRR